MNYFLFDIECYKMKLNSKNPVIEHMMQDQTSLLLIEVYIQPIIFLAYYQVIGLLNLQIHSKPQHLFVQRISFIPPPAPHFLFSSQSRHQLHPEYL